MREFITFQKIIVLFYQEKEWKKKERNNTKNKDLIFKFKLKFQYEVFACLYLSSKFKQLMS